MEAVRRNDADDQSNGGGGTAQWRHLPGVRGDGERDGGRGDSDEHGDKRERPPHVVVPRARLPPRDALRPPLARDATTP